MTKAEHEAFVALALIVYRQPEVDAPTRECSWQH